MGKSDNKSEDASDKEKEVAKKQASEAKEKEQKEGPKEDTENLRKVIKLNENADEEKEEKKPDKSAKEKKKDEDDDIDGIDDLDKKDEEEGTKAPVLSREELEQKRAILQRIKDFDFQIKKNQQEIIAVGEKINALSKDIDDLVSLYEIVSEQMNPFVGLSKVTKKRLESLENITKEVDALKEKLSMIEDRGPIQTVQQQPLPPVKPSYEVDLSDLEMERIIEMSFTELIPDSSIDTSIDTAIDVFIENLKDGKTM